MVTVTGTVQNGIIKLPETMRVSNGSRVIITILGAMKKNGDHFFPPSIEMEDLAFVRACRGRLAKQLQEADQ